MKLKRKLCMFILTSILITSQVFAIPVEPVKIEDTFTHENIEDTVAINKSAMYMITNTNTVKGVGLAVWGAGQSVTNSKTWVDIVKNEYGDLLEDIIKVKCNSGGVYFLNSKGELFVSIGAIVKKIDIPEDLSITDIKITDVPSMDAYSKVLALCENGDVYLIPRTNIATKIAIEWKISKIFRHTTNSQNLLALTDDGVLINLYTLKEVKTASGQQIKNVKEILPLRDSVILLSENGKVTNFTNSMLSSSSIEFYKETENISNSITVEEMLGGIKNTSITDVYFKTNKGYFKLETTTSAKYYEDFDYTPVAILSYESEKIQAVLDNEGYIHTYGTDINGILGSAGYGNITKYRHDWMNDNPIVTETKLANFSIEHNTLLGRVDTYDVVFSLVAEETPKAFNLYYVKSNDYSDTDKTTWKQIASNIDILNLKVEEYDTGYIDNANRKITGNTYTYIWSVPKVDLTNIKLIVEPIY